MAVTEASTAAAPPAQVRRARRDSSGSSAGSDSSDDGQLVLAARKASTRTPTISTAATETQPVRLPTLLGWGRHQGHQSEPCVVKVKNTFIDGFADDGGEDGRVKPRVLSRQKSCPVPLCTGHSEDEEHDEMPSEWLMMVQVPSLGAKAAPAEAAGAVEIPPLRERRPSLSLGSQIHGTGECRPCAWFWRSQGCQNGVECRHCHLCLPGEVKARRKKRIAIVKSEGREGLAVDEPMILNISECI